MIIIIIIIKICICNVKYNNVFFTVDNILDITIMYKLEVVGVHMRVFMVLRKA